MIGFLCIWFLMSHFASLALYYLVGHAQVISLIVQKTLQEQFVERNDFSSSNRTKDDNNDCSYNLLNATQAITFIMNSNDEQH